jgi:hypothetical protein
MVAWLEQERAVGFPVLQHVHLKGRKEAKTDLTAGCNNYLYYAATLGSDRSAFNNKTFSKQI